MNILSIVYKKNVKVFKLITCNTVDTNRFYLEYIAESEGSLDIDSSNSLDVEGENLSKRKVTHEEVNVELTDEIFDFKEIFNMEKFDKRTLDLLNDVQTKQIN